MGREIRRVPKNWEHPKQIIKNWYPSEGYKIAEKYRPMYQSSSFEEAVEEFNKEVKEWTEGYELWQKGFYKAYWEPDRDKIVPKEKVFKHLIKYLEDEKKQYRMSNDYHKEELQKYKTGICSWSDIHGETPRYPDPDMYMPSGEWYQLFEDVSEGTPLTPAFEKPEQLVDWLANNKDYWGEQWIREQAEAIVKQGSAMSMVVSDGKVYNSRESLLMK